MNSAAATLGERLLGEVHEEGLDELLRDLRVCHHQISETGHATPRTGVRQLDDLLDIFLDRGRTTTVPIRVNPEHQGPAAGRETINAIEQQAHDPPPEQALKPDSSHSEKQKKLPVLEISSPSSGAGKSQLLYYLAALAVIPSSYRGVHLGGQDAAVVLLDTDGRFDADRLWDVAWGIIRRKLHTQSRENSESTENGEIDSLLLDALQHVHIFRPQSSSALLSTLQSLDSYLFDLTKHFSTMRSMHAILLDSASAFYWQDRLRDEVARVEEIGRSPAEIASGREQKRSFYLVILYRDLVAELRRLQILFQCTVVYTTWGVSRATSSAASFSSSSVSYSRSNHGPPSFRPHLPSPWGSFPTLRLVVQRDAVRPFGPDATVTEAERDAAIRQAVVQQGKFSAWIDSWGNDEWPLTVTSALNRMPERGGFPFWVTGDGVLMEN